MYPYKYSCDLKVGDYLSVLIIDSNELDASFCVTNKPFYYDQIHKEISKMPLPKRLCEISMGAPCLVRYKDKCLYRAVILNSEVNQEDNFNVYFVDFGNVWSANLNDIYMIDKSIFDIPVSVHLCKLENLDNPINFELIASILKEITNLDETILSIQVISIQDNVNYVYLFQHSINRFVYINQILNPSIKLKESPVEASNDNSVLEISNDFENLSIGMTMSKDEVIKKFLKQKSESEDFLIDDNVQPINIKVQHIVSPIQFYAEIQADGTKKYYKDLFKNLNDMNSFVEKRIAPNFYVDDICSYYCKHLSQWKRCKLISISKGEYWKCNVLDIDTLEDITIFIKPKEISLNLRNIGDKIDVSSKLIQCQIPNLALIDDECNLNILKMFSKKHYNNLFILPFRYEKGKLLANLYGCQRITTKIIDKKYLFESYYTYLIENYFNCLIQHEQVPDEYLENIYRNITESDLKFTSGKRLYFKYPNTNVFKGFITSVNYPEIYFRFSEQNLFNIVQEEIRKVLRSSRQKRKIERSLNQFDSLLAFDTKTETWRRVQLIGFERDNSIVKLKVSYLDIGGSGLCLLENVYDYNITPHIPSLAISANVRNSSIKQNNLFGKSVMIKWMNFPDLPMEVCIQTLNQKKSKKQYKFE